ncbi:MAG: S9 family peptidase [Bacteroidetes Order II. Incertae sedis bacterium]|nr:S9 family peptidase [Bacteroidetes Order II. bacterium]
MRSYLRFCLFVMLAGSGWLFAQNPASGMLTFDQLFSGHFGAEGFGPVRWMDGGASYTTLERPANGSVGQDLVAYDTATGVRRILIPAKTFTPKGSEKAIEIEDYEWSPDHKQMLLFTNSERVWRTNTRGDYWVLEVASGKLWKLGGKAPASTLMFAKFSPDGKQVAYVRQNNIYTENLTTGRILQLTRDGNRTTINGTFDWVYEEEFGLQDGFRWSPDSKSIAYWQLDAKGVRDFLLINNTDSLYSYVIPIQYPKAGTTNSAARVGVVPATGGLTKWMNVPGDLRNNYIARMEWAGNAHELVIQRMNRKQNTNQVMLCDVKTGRTRTVFTDADPKAWVDVVDDLIWTDSEKAFTWVSERDGWRKLYKIQRDGSRIEAITKGDFDVARVLQIDPASGWVYYIASPENPTQRYLYRIRLDGTGNERLTPKSQAGVHQYNVSPNGQFALHTWSAFGTPPTTEIIRLPAHETLRIPVPNTRLKERVAAVRAAKSEFFRIDAGNGVQLDGWIMKPADFDPSKKYPILYHVYGEPAGQTVMDSWGGRNFLWHTMLTQKGYIVASLDNQGTPSLRGRDWRKIIYGQIGVLASQEQVTASRNMAQKWSWIDSTRVGVWGWSGGGSMTLNLLFRSSDWYKTGMSVAPVPDQRLYDTIYQERYMDTPQDNPEGYRIGSPLTFAHQLKGNLLVVHGTGDDNVHYQGTERLINALIEANKPFTMMAYPNRAHGIYEGKNTSRHLYELLTRYLLSNLEAGAR